MKCLDEATIRLGPLGGALALSGIVHRRVGDVDRRVDELTEELAETKNAPPPSPKIPGMPLPAGYGLQVRGPASEEILLPICLPPGFGPESMMLVPEFLPRVEGSTPARAPSTLAAPGRRRSERASRTRSTAGAARPEAERRTHERRPPARVRLRPDLLVDDRALRGRTALRANDRAGSPALRTQLASEAAWPRSTTAGGTPTPSWSAAARRARGRRAARRRSVPARARARGGARLRPARLGRWPAELLDAREMPPSPTAGATTRARLYPGRVIAFERARVIGGCSSHNGCAALWGSRADYDGWAARGMPGWTTEELLPLFRRVSDDCAVHHAGDGELGPYHRAVWTRRQALGIPRVRRPERPRPGRRAGPFAANIRERRALERRVRLPRSGARAAEPGDPAATRSSTASCSRAAAALGCTRSATAGRS